MEWQVDQGHLAVLCGTPSRSKRSVVYDLCVCELTPFVAAKPLLIVFWSDEWKQYNGVKYRALYMRILNDTEITKHLIGVFPEGAFFFFLRRCVVVYPLQRCACQCGVPNVRHP